MKKILLFLIIICACACTDGRESYSFVGRSSRYYHKYMQCEGLATSQGDISMVTTETAKGMGKRECKYCYKETWLITVITILSLLICIKPISLMFGYFITSSKKRRIWIFLSMVLTILIMGFVSSLISPNIWVDSALMVASVFGASLITGFIYDGTKKENQP